MQALKTVLRSGKMFSPLTFAMKRLVLKVCFLKVAFRFVHPEFQSRRFSEPEMCTVDNPVKFMGGRLAGKATIFPASSEHV